MLPPIKNEAAKDGFTITTIEEKVVSDYANLPITETENLNCFYFWLLLRDAVIYYNRQTEDGKEKLFAAWQLMQTSPDKEKLRAKGMRKIG